jgi:hypothetical protein
MEEGSSWINLRIKKDGLSTLNLLEWVGGQDRGEGNLTREGYWKGWYLNSA